MQQGQPGNAPRERERDDAAATPAREEWPAAPVGGRAVPRPYPAGGDAYRLAAGRGDGEERGGYATPELRGGADAGSPNGRAATLGREEPPPWEEGEPGYGSWEWESALNRSLPGSDLDDLTGTGRLSAVRPLRPGDRLWSAGVSAPGRALERPGAGAVVEEQPSARMRALQPGNLARATVIITVFIMISRVLGLLRTSLFAYAFGTTLGVVSDAYTQAFALPDAIFNIVAGGALASAFIPVFTDYLVAKKDRQTAWHVASSAFNISTVVLIALAGGAIYFAPEITRWTLPTLFVKADPEGPLVVTLERVMLLQPIFLGVATLGVGVLQARQRFLLPALGQAIYTVGPIAGILATILDRQTGIFGGHLGIMGPTWGVVAGAALQFAVLIPGLVAARMRYRLVFDFLHPGVRETFRLMVPRIVNASMNYVSIFISRNFLGLLAQGATYGYLTAFTLVQLPLSLFSSAVAQAAFPTLAAFVADGEWDRLRTTITTTLKGVIYLAIPSSLGMAVLAGPIVRVLLAHGHYAPTTGAIDLTAIPLVFFSIGLLGLAMNEILTRTFYALKDSRTPVIINLLSLPFVLGLSEILLVPMGAGGLALAFALGALGEGLTLLLLLNPRVGGLNLRGLALFGLNVLAASLVMALSALFVYTLGEVVLPVGGSPLVQTAYLLVRLGAAIVVALVVYYLLSRFLGIDDALPLERVLGRMVRLGRR